MKMPFGIRCPKCKAPGLHAEDFLGMQVLVDEKGDIHSCPTSWPRKQRYVTRPKWVKGW